jgi:hypothetical protein
LCQTFFRTLYRELKPTSYLIEKNNLIDLSPFIRTTFPDARMLAIYRDGRDVVVSDKYFQQNERGRANSFRERVLRWRRAMEWHAAYAPKYDIFSCSFEALLEDGVSVTRQALAFLRLCDDAEIIDRMVTGSSFRARSGRRYGVDPRRNFYRKGIVGDWKNHFTEQEKDVFKDVAGDILIQFGYERDMNW